MSRRTAPGFLAGIGVGGAAAVAVVGLADPVAAGDWVVRNLGHSVWAFGAVLVFWIRGLLRLEGRLAVPADAEEEAGRVVMQLDQLTDVWISVFIGIGVIWTAIGMRGALQATLGDPDAALQGSAGSVLASLVDGGILLALTTTIVGAVGGYLMRLIKTLWLGPALHRFHEGRQGREVRALLDAVRRIETRIETGIERGIETGIETGRAPRRGSPLGTGEGVGSHVAEA